MFYTGELGTTYDCTKLYTYGTIPFVTGYTRLEQFFTLPQYATVLQTTADKKLTTNPLPAIRLTSFSDTDISYTNDNYLAISSGVSTIVNGLAPSIGILQLSDYSHDPGRDRYVVTYFTGTDVWYLAPEYTSVVTASDVIVENVPVTGTILYTKRTESQQRTKPFSISDDASPKLYTHIDCATFPITKQAYKVQTLSLADSVETVTLDIDKYDHFVVVCTDNVLAINFNPSTINFTGYKSVIIETDNFNGTITFPYQCKFENGQVPVFTGKLTLFCLTIVTTGITAPTVIVTQKLNNLAQP